ncbi:MAG: molybdopterin-dependent oxidoreductase [Methanoregula sp.]|nr:MAG: molybdopterin-dependent oxidoreductase [Methanoregula sp.]
MSVKALLVVAIIMVIGLLYLIDISGFPAADQGLQATALIPVEIRSYEGERLSSINDFRENSIKGPQYISEDRYVLTVDGLVTTPLSFPYRDVIDHHIRYTKRVTLHCVEGWDATILWEGVLVRDLLTEAGVRDGATTVIFHAHDGYTTSFPVDYFMAHDIIMAYRMNNVTLPAERGFPFQLVAEDKWGYKWIRWIERIELSDQAGYRGYWEQRGYSNSGDLNRSFFS